MHKFGLRTDNRCQRYQRPGADFVPIAWACPELEIYWRQVTEALSQMLTDNVPNTPLACLLGIHKIKQVRRRKLLAVALLLAKRRVAIKWDSKRPPRFKNWMSDILYYKESMGTYQECLPMASRPKDFWQPLVAYMQAGQESP